MEEYRAVRERAGLLDRAARGKLMVTGADRFSWLQGMVSNDVRQLEAGAPVIHACVLNPTGHLLADLAIIPFGDGLLLDMARENAEKIFRLLEGFLILEDVEIEDQSDFLACLSVQGPGATEAWTREAAGDAAFCVPADHTGAGGFDLYVPSEQAPALREKLIAAGATPVSAETAEILRVEAGIPLYGVDMDESTIPLEANLDATHFSHTKGCYVGQEVIARIHSRGHTNRALTGLILEGDTLPAKGDKIRGVEDGTEREVGWITSPVRSPALGTGIALGYVRHESRAPGSPVQIEAADGAIPARVSPLPFRA